MWFVVIEKGARRTARAIRAASSEDAQEQVKLLVGGPLADDWRVVRCVPVD